MTSVEQVSEPIWRSCTNCFGLCNEQRIRPSSSCTDG